MKSEQIMLDFIDRHTIAADRCLPIEDRERAMLAIDVLLRAGRISEWNHACGLRYWTAASEKPLSDASLTRSLAILTFCHGSKSRSLITRAELEHYFPQMFRHGLPAGHYIENSADFTRLGNIRVDAGLAKINRIVARTQRAIQKYEQQPGFRDLIRNSDFELTWIVPTPPKQRRLTESLAPLSGSGVHLRVIAIPELLNVIAHLPKPIE